MFKGEPFRWRERYHARGRIVYRHTAKQLHRERSHLAVGERPRSRRGIRGGVCNIAPAGGRGPVSAAGWRAGATWRPINHRRLLSRMVAGLHRGSAVMHGSRSGHDRGEVAASKARLTIRHKAPCIDSRAYNVLGFLQLQKT